MAPKSGMGMEAGGGWCFWQERQKMQSVECGGGGSYGLSAERAFQKYGKRGILCSLPTYTVGIRVPQS